MKQINKIFIFICAITLYAEYASADNQYDRSKRGIFDIFSSKKEVKTPVKVLPLYPIWKFHKYNGVEVKPVPLSELSRQKIYTTTSPPVKNHILPSLEQLKLLFGTTSNAETFDALKELASSRHGLRMIAGFIKANIDNAKSVFKHEEKPHLDNYEYSAPAEENVKPVEPHYVPAPDAKTEPTTQSKHPIQLGIDYVKSILNHEGSQKTKILVPPKVFELPKAHGHSKFQHVQPFHTQKSVDSVFHSDSFNHSENGSKTEILPYYEIPKIQTYDGAEVNSKFASSQFQESFAGTSYQINPVSFSEEYGLPPVEYGTPNFYEKPPPIEVSGNFKSDTSIGNAGNAEVVENTYGLPPINIENTQNAEASHTIYGVPSIKSGSFKSSKTQANVYIEPSSNSQQSFNVHELKKNYGTPFANKKNFKSILKNHFKTPKINVENSGSVLSSSVIKPHSEYGVPKEVHNEFKSEKFLQFPILPQLPSLPEPEDIAKFHKSHPDERILFSYTGPIRVKSSTSFFKPKFVETKFEQPGFSYTQLSSLPLEDGVSLKKTSGQISSYGDQVSPYVFDEDYTSAPSERKSFVVKAKIMIDDQKVKAKKSEVVTSAPRRRWVPKSKRKHRN